MFVLVRENDFENFFFLFSLEIYDFRIFIDDELTTWVFEVKLYPLLGWYVYFFYFN